MALVLSLKNSFRGLRRDLPLALQIQRRSILTQSSKETPGVVKGRLEEHKKTVWNTIPSFVNQINHPLPRVLSGSERSAPSTIKNVRGKVAYKILSLSSESVS